ncbi:MAG: response regulator [Trueperaceae bacterium]|nr:MAG: response regulator [Trueperaceae bacterium]
MSTSTVLVADADPLQRQLLDMLLSVESLDVTMVASGEEALAHLRSHTPDVVLMAMDLPDVAGSVICRKVKSVKRLMHVPVVLVAPEPSAGGTLGDSIKREARDVGADLLLQKPLGDKNLRERVQRLLAAPPVHGRDGAIFNSAVLESSSDLDEFGSLGNAPTGAATELGGLRAEVARLRHENESLKARLAKLKERAKVLQDELEEAKKPRGLFGRRGG